LYFIIITILFVMPEFFFIESLGELYEQVQDHQIFPDSKTFVDSTPRDSVARIRSAYEADRKKPGFDLRSFVNEYFTLPTQLSTAYLSSGKTLEQHIETLWTVLRRVPSEASPISTLIPLPYPYIVPGGRFREIFYWDSYFTMLGLQESGHMDLVASMIENFAYLIEQVGFVPNGNRTYFLSRSQPPFFSLMLELLPADQQLHYLPCLEKEYAFWMDDLKHRLVVLDDGLALNRYWDNKCTVRPEAYREETLLAKRSGQAPEEIYLHIRAACESGWDYSSRWFSDGLNMESIETTNIIPVDLNCLLLHMEETLQRLYTAGEQHGKARDMENRATRRRTAIQRHCWNEELGFYVDYHIVKQQPQVDKLTLAAVFPLFFKLATDAQAQQVAHTIEKLFLHEGGLLTTLVQSGQQWDAPNGWAPLQWMAYVGLRNYGLTTLADTVSTRWRHNCERVYAETGMMMEKYDVVNVAARAGGGKHPNQDGFGWTNGVYIKLLRS
jgi:alpha,alpha-trehalase